MFCALPGKTPELGFSPFNPAVAQSYSHPLRASKRVINNGIMGKSLGGVGVIKTKVLKYKHGSGIKIWKLLLVFCEMRRRLCLVR